MQRFTLFLCGLCLSASAFSETRQTFEQPVVQAGDTWVYRVTTEKGPGGWVQGREEVAVNRVSASAIYYSHKASGSTQPGIDAFGGRDWSRIRAVNGKETVVIKPLAFPLTVGKTWDTDFTEQHPTPQKKYERTTDQYSVVGFETVEVPAGRFRALKIEMEGKWVAELEPTRTVVQGAQVSQGNTTMVSRIGKSSTDAFTGRRYKAFWYAPEVKRWVKSVEEFYGSNGTRDERSTGELESFKPAVSDAQP